MNLLHPLHNQRGVSLMVVLVMVVVIGLSASMAGNTWRAVMQREREEELLFRGDQYRRAIESYYKVGHGGTLGMYPSSLEDLIKDPRSAQTRRHLRRLYKDPMTGEDFELVQQGGDVTGLAGTGPKLGAIRGVRSTSDLEPFKQDGFRKPYENFNGATSYQDWSFTFEPQAAAQGPGGPGGPGGPTPPLNPPLPGTQPQSGPNPSPNPKGGDDRNPFR